MTVPAITPPPPKPDLRPTTEPEPEPVAEAEPEAEPEAEAGESDSESSEAAGQANAEAESGADQGDAASTAATGGGDPGARADYMTRLQAWLGQHKEYPRRAQMRRQQGTGLLYFAIDRQGRVLEYRLEESSGHALLDREIEAMIQRADPLPAMPDDVPGERLELVVPVEFSLR